MMRKLWLLTGIMLLLVSWLLIGCGVAQEQHDAVVAELNSAQTQIQSLQSELDTTKSELQSAKEQLLAATVFPTQTIEKVIPSEAISLIQEKQSNPDFIVVDVQPLEEYERRHIDNAINVPIDSEAFLNELDRLDKNKAYLIYGQCGLRSVSASMHMAELNFEEVYWISGGMNRWGREGFPTVSE